MNRVVAIGLMVGFFVLATQLSITAMYNGRILPGVVVADHALGGLSVADARIVLQKAAQNYRLDLTVATEHYELTGSQIGVAFDSEASLKAAYQAGRENLFPPLVQRPLPLAYHLDRSQLNGFAASVAARVGVQPVDAALLVHGVDIQTLVEKSGWTVDRLGLERIIEQDVRSPGGVKLQLGAREQRADIQAASLGPIIDETKLLMATPVVLTYGDRTFTPSPAEIGQWISFDKLQTDTAARLVAKVDTLKLKSYINNLANQIDLTSVAKKITIENGVQKVTQEGVDGLSMDRDRLTAALSTAISHQQPLTYEITAHAVPFKTLSTTLVSLDYGKYIEVNLSKQHLWVWQDHTVIYETPITTGATGAGFPTVTGLFSIFYKTTNTHLVGNQYGPRYVYDVPVKYWMPFYSGFGLHDATWRNGNFGGQDYYYGGSHGCVNLPDDAAAFIYNWSEIGTPVWVHK